MFVYPIFWGCKYTNNFLFINKKAEFQHIKLLITSISPIPAGSWNFHISQQSLAYFRIAPAVVTETGSRHHLTQLIQNPTSL